jgi:hypothetical protein
LLLRILDSGKAQLIGIVSYLYNHTPIHRCKSILPFEMIIALSRVKYTSLICPVFGKQSHPHDGV